MKNLPFQKRFQFACNGLRFAFISESSFRTHVIAGLGVLLGLVLLKAKPAWWAIVLLTIAGVLSLELINTALEQLLDYLHPEIHPIIKLVKDCAAGAVLVFSLFAVAVFAAFLWDRFF